MSNGSQTLGHCLFRNTINRKRKEIIIFIFTSVTLYLFSAVYNDSDR